MQATVADVVIVPWRMSGFVCSDAAVTEWEWNCKPFIHCRHYCRQRRSQLIMK